MGVLPACEANARGQLSGKRFLVVEDNFLLALNMAAALEDAGAEVTWTGVAEEAVHTIEARPPVKPPSVFLSRTVNAELTSASISA